MNRIALCCSPLLVVATLCASSCVPASPELPADQERKVRLHRMTPSEDLAEMERSKDGAPLPPAREGSWKF